MKKNPRTRHQEVSVDELLRTKPEFMAEIVRIANQNLMQWDKQMFESLQAHIRQNIEKRTYKTDENLDVFLDNIVQEDVELAERLEEVNFWITPSMGANFVIELKEFLSQPKIKPIKVEKAFVEYYHSNNYLMLRKMVQSWRESKFFSPRMKIISDARDAHINRKYSLSIPALIPQIEGILSSLTGKPAGRPSKIFIEALVDKYTDVNYAVSKNIIRKLALGTALYGSVPNEYFIPERYDEWIKENSDIGDMVINRHAILHGVQINYATVTNSLRTFLLLDVLYWMSKPKK